MSFCTSIEPKMHDLNRFVIPDIAAKWTDVAYALLCEIPLVESIKMNHTGDVKGCCKELFEKWLTTNSGKRHKIWKTLINALGEIDELMSVTQKITDRLIQMDSK